MAHLTHDDVNLGPDAERAADTATWRPVDLPAEVTASKSRPPRMTYFPWRRSQEIDLGATAGDAHYWRCPNRECRVWCGPYPNPIEAKREGYEHLRLCGRKPLPDPGPVRTYDVDDLHAADTGRPVDRIPDPAFGDLVPPLCTAAPVPGQRAGNNGPTPLPAEFANVIEAWGEAVGQEFPPDGAIVEIDTWFAALGETLRQMGDTIRAAADALADTTPLGPFLDHLDRCGAALHHAGTTGDQVHATWRTEFAPHIARQEHPRPHEAMLNVRH